MSHEWIFKKKVLSREHLKPALNVFAIFYYNIAKIE